MVFSFYNKKITLHQADFIQFSLPNLFCSKCKKFLIQPTFQPTLLDKTLLAVTVTVITSTYLLKQVTRLSFLPSSSIARCSADVWVNPVHLMVISTSGLSADQTESLHMLFCICITACEFSSYLSRDLHFSPPLPRDLPIIQIPTLFKDTTRLIPDGVYQDLLPHQ